jgi:hypothetical protein
MKSYTKPRQIMTRTIHFRKGIEPRNTTSRHQWTYYFELFLVDFQHILHLWTKWHHMYMYVVLPTFEREFSVLLFLFRNLFVWIMGY